VTGSRARRAGAAEESLLQVWVRPGASHRAVGGRHDGALAVRVTARAVDGAATEAVLEAVAVALGLPRRQVSLVRGATSRRKVLRVALGQVELERRLEALAEPERC
jgi:hypothetical protein